MHMNTSITAMMIVKKYWKIYKLKIFFMVLKVFMRSIFKFLMIQLTKNKNKFQKKHPI